MNQYNERNNKGSDLRPSARTRRLGVVVAILVGFAIAALLTAYLSSVALPIISRAFASTPDSATHTQLPTPGSADWFTFKSWAGGFQIAMPGVIGSSHGYFINDGYGQGADFYYGDAPITSPLQRREAQLWVKVLYSTRITDQNVCPQGGTAVKIGPIGHLVSAWVRNEGRIVALNLVLNGTAIEIDLDSRDDSQPALANYGDIWRHMLASFTPLPVVRQLATHPCG